MYRLKSASSIGILVKKSLAAMAGAVAIGMMLGTHAEAISLGGVSDQSPEDLDRRIGFIKVGGEEVLVTWDKIIPGGVIKADTRWEAKQSKRAVDLSIKGILENRSDSEITFTLKKATGYSLDPELVGKMGRIYAALSGELIDLDPFGLPTSNGASGISTTIVDGFAPNTVSTSDTVPKNRALPDGLFSRKTLRGELVSENGTVNVETVITLGAKQALIFRNSFDGGLEVPEPSSILALLSLGGAAALGLKRKL